VKTSNILTTLPNGGSPKLAHKELTHQIIGAGIHVLKTLGPGFVEQVYHNAMCLTLDKRGLAFDKEVDFPVVFEGVEVGRHRLDLLVEDKIVVELKACARVEARHVKVVGSYLAATGLDYGLVLNFSNSPLEIRRVVRKGA
jgi:GxxExxY protein